MMSLTPRNPSRFWKWPPVSGRWKAACGPRTWPDADYETVGGMVMSCLNAIPQDGARFTVETNGLRIAVEDVRDRKIVRARIEKIPAGNGEPDTPAEESPAR